MRAVLRRKASVHVVERAVLLNVFAKVLKKRSCDAKDTVRTEQFQAVWQHLGVRVTSEEAVALFNKYGQVRPAQQVRAVPVALLNIEPLGSEFGGRSTRNSRSNLPHFPHN
jgi:hypothetical protein